MATCPRCGGFLHEHHHCAGLWRLRLRGLSVLVLGGVGGAVGGWLILVAVMGQASWLAVAVAASSGVFVVMALRRSW
jgi:hypothetical protein